MSFYKWASITSTSSSFETKMQHWFAVLHSHASHWLTKEMTLRFRIIAQYMVKTKFDDALKILVVREKMAN